MQRKGITLLAKSFSAIVFFIATTFAAFANTGSECYIERNAAGYYDMMVSSVVYNVPTRQVTVPSEIAAWDVPIVLRGDGIGCKAIPNGDSSVHFLNSADANLLSGYTAENGIALLKTTVPGIVYGVELICFDCPSVVDLRLPQTGEDSFKLNTGTWWEWANSDNKWSLRFRLFMTPEFQPKNGVSSGTLVPGQIASWYIGINDQPWINFKVNTDSLAFSVEEPTCTTIALDSTSQSVSGNEIKLGDYYISQMKQEITREVPFSIRADYCYANKITIKLKAANEAPDKKLIGKSSGTATGVGVKVYSTSNNNKVQLNADGSNSAIFTYENWSNNLLFFPFSAQLVKDGGNGTIGAGDFSGKATFTFSYE